METFDYSAIDKAGKRQSGSLSALSARDARDILRERKLTPVSLKTAKAKAETDRANASGLKTSHKDKTLATRQLAILFGAATPVEEALKVVALQFVKSPMRAILLDVRTRVLEGARLSEGMRGHPKTFDDLYIAMVASGEASGKLPSVMERLAVDMEAAQKMRRSIIGATVYPILLLIIAVVVVIILMVVVVPQVVEQFNSFGQELPLLTRAVIGLSAWMKAYGIYVVILAIAAGFAVHFALRQPAIKLAWHRFFLKLPMLGKVSRNLNAARFARTISGLISSGTPSLPAMETARHTLSNQVMNAAVLAASEKVREGTSISAALRQTDVFPPLVTQMVAGGEASGDIGQMFAKSADYLEEEFESATSVFLSLLQPLIILFVAAIVLLIIAAIFLPILQLNTAAF